MLLVLSPAKSLDYETPSPTPKFTEPRLLDESARLIERLREFSPAEIASLMSLSDPLAVLNHARYAEWSRPFSPANAKPSVFAFNGDVYDGLAAATLPAKSLDWLQGHVRILSGLYGLLRPLDLMQAYRLEMGTKLKNARGKDLYAFWGERITELLAADLKAAKARVLVNLASEEYFKSVKPALLDVPVVQPVFEDWKGGRYKIISFYAKRARGLMSRYVITNRIDEVDALQGFDAEGYAFAADASDADTLVFRRREE